MVHNVTKRPRRKSAPPALSLDESLDNVVAAREHGAGAAGQATAAAPLLPTEDAEGAVLEARRCRVRNALAQPAPPILLDKPQQHAISAELRVAGNAR